MENPPNQQEAVGAGGSSILTKATWEITKGASDFFFFFWWHWGLNSRPPIDEASVPLLELLLQWFYFFCVRFFSDRVS
jgi:hypothetical protein